MACIRPCPYCGENTTASWHQSCRIAHLEGLLAQVKATLEKGPLSDQTNPLLTAAILFKKFKTWDQYKKERNEEALRTRAKELHDFERNEAMRKAAEEFDLAHLDPKPNIY